jgi:hypothetical protein
LCFFIIFCIFCIMEWETNKNFRKCEREFHEIWMRRTPSQIILLMIQIRFSRQSRKLHQEKINSQPNIFLLSNYFGDSITLPFRIAILWHIHKLTDRQICNNNFQCHKCTLLFL